MHKFVIQDTSGDGCAGTFPMAVLRRTLDAKVMAKYEEAQAREAIEAARKARLAS